METGPSIGRRHPLDHLIYLALGSNLEDRQANLRQALMSLAPGVEVLERSPIYETEPWGYQDQPRYLNQVVSGTTRLAPLALLQHLKSIEVSLGRTPSFRYGPRLIDLDILFYDDLVLESDELTIPHPRLTERAFVLVPLGDLAPDLRHPILGVTVLDLLQRLDRSGVRAFSPTT